MNKEEQEEKSGFEKAIEYTVNSNKSKDQEEFIEYLKEERKQMSRVASDYEVSNHLILRNQIDSFLIAYDQSMSRLSDIYSIEPICNHNYEFISLFCGHKKCKNCGKLKQ